MMIAEKIRRAGGNVYLVGGAVRDQLMGKTPKDKDYCVTGISAEEFSRLFPEAILTGKDFPVFRIDGEEYALARTERKTGRGYKGFQVDSSPEVTIEEDLRRRDLTINSVAIEVATGEVVDPFGGVEDIRRGIIRATSEAFREDPLRVYRAARFAARFGFRVEPGTLAMMRDMKEELPALTPERVGLEVIKAALETENPSIFFRVLAEADVLDVHFPELSALIGVPQPPEHHPEGDAFEHSMQVLDAMARMTKDPVLRWVAVVHDLGKGVTPKELLPRHHGHEKAGVPLVEALGRRIRLPKRYTQAAKVGAAEHMRAFRIGEMRPGKAVRLLEQVRKTALGVEGLSLLVKADHRGRNNPDAEVPEAEELIRMAEVIFSVTGRDIDANPGPGFAEKLTQARVRKLMAYRA